MPKTYPYLLDKIQPDPTEFELDFFEERAGISEYLADFDRPEAEKYAMEEIMKQRQNNSEENKNDTSYIEALKLISDIEQLKPLNVAQDFIDGVMYYGLRLGSKSFLITSKRKLFQLEDAVKIGFNPNIKEVEMSKFSKNGIESFIKGNTVNPYQLFTEIKSYIKEYAHLHTDSFYDLISIWVMGTYTFRLFEYYPYIHLIGEKNSGKTLLIDVLASICFNGEISSSTTAAVIYRSVENLSPTMFVDEAENLNSRLGSEAKNVLMEVLRTGFHKSGVVKRCDKEVNFKIKSYRTYSPKMFASINEFDNVLRDRAIKIIMYRKLETEVFKRYRQNEDTINYQQNLCDALYSFGLQFCSEISTVLDTNSEAFNYLSNRDSDLWNPILTIATLIDGCSENPTSLLVTNRIIGLSQKILTEKVVDDSIDNITVKLLLVLNRLLTEEKPRKIEGKLIFYDTGITHNYFNKQDEFEFGLHKTSLSRGLTGLGVIINEYKNADTKKTSKEYVIDVEIISDLTKRYGV